MTTTTFVLVSGLRYAGKDTFCDLLVRAFVEHNPKVRVTRTAFAEALKREYAASAPGGKVDFSRLMTDAAYKEQHRPQLIAWGKAARAREPSVWARHVYEHVTQPCPPAPTVVIVSDWRFLNEARFLSAQPNTTVLCFRVCSSDSVRRERGWVYNRAIDEDPSETELNSCVSIRIANNDSLAALYSSCVDVVLTTASENVFF